jgi:hypothetical protein
MTIRENWHAVADRTRVVDQNDAESNLIHQHRFICCKLCMRKHLMSIQAFVKKITNLPLQIVDGLSGLHYIGLRLNRSAA